MKQSRFRLPLYVMMIAVVFVGFVMFLVRQMYFANTVYSPRYDESRFQKIRVGMMSEEVEALLGPPLSKYPWPEEGTAIWLYTDKLRGGGDYWKREIAVKNREVVYIINMYWRD